MRILAIETSCDETGVCLLETVSSPHSPKVGPLCNKGPTFGGVPAEVRILGNALYSQVAVHAPYGGVYPNLAKREHSKNLVPVMIECLAAAGELHPAPTSPIEGGLASLKGILEREPELFAELASFLARHDRPQIDAIAVTHGPGLEPALWVGVNFARALSQLWDVPVVPVNHMEGHIIMPMMESVSATNYRLHPASYPLLALLVSGGHTELVLSREPFHYEMLGQTRDDAAGEAFDKVARMLGLPYPGGPEISRLAAAARASGVDSRYVFPRPMLYQNNFDFSFAGLKTELRKHVQALDELTDETRGHTAWAFEDAVVDTLVHKTAKAADEHGAQTVVLGGGVSANTHLRAQLKEVLDARGITLLVPPPVLSTDNAIMIALAGALHATQDHYADPATLRAQGHLKLA